MSVLNIQTTQISDAQAEGLLTDLVSIASPSTQEAAAVSHLVAWMGANGYDESFIDAAGNAVGIVGAQDAAQTVVLLGHIDTFGGNPPVRLEGRDLYGRGAVDAKGALCGFAVAVARLAAQRPANTRFVVIGAVEEEAASSKGARHVVNVYQPQLCVIGEPSGWDRITLGYKGRLMLDWRWQGGLAHSAGEAASAPEHAFAYWARVLAYAEHFNAGRAHKRTRIFDKLDVTLQAINSGHDGVDGWAEMSIGFRLPLGVDPQALADTLADENVTRAYSMEHAYLAERDSALSRVMRGAIRQLGGQPAFVNKTGTSDMNIVGRVWNCPILAYGAGDSALDHTPHEHLNLDEYLRAIRVLTAALAALN